MSHLSRAPGKMILLGEYAVLEGADALVAAVDRYATLQIESSPDFTFSSPAIGINGQVFSISPNCEIEFRKEGMTDLNFFSMVLGGLLKFAEVQGGDLQPFSINLDTSDFYLGQLKSKLGLGSSAALTVALTHAILNHVNIKKNRKDLFKISLQAHRQAQGNTGSGIDVAASVFGGLLKFRRFSQETEASPGIKQINMPPLLHLCAVWSGKSASTSGFLRDMALFRKKATARFNAIMHELIDLSTEGCAALTENKVQVFLDKVHNYYLMLEKLTMESGVPIISEVHKQLAALVAEAGGVYKPSGAGGGDIGIAFCESPKVSESIKSILSDHKFSILDLHIVDHGVQ